MKKLVLLFSLFAIHQGIAQTTSTFEDFNLGIDSSLNGSDQQGGFQNGNLYFPNTYDAQFNSWFGFGISSITDNTTAGFTNDLSCIAGEGALNSTTYAVAFMSYLTNNAVIELTGPAAGGAMEGIYVNNSTYAFLSMRDGDAVAKKFGGISGNDPDFFLLTIEKYENGALGTEKIEFYLADFRSPNNANDYIVDEWTYIDLSSLGNADSLAFSLSSSDIGQFGMNTPAYFCLDNVSTKDGIATGLRAEEVDLNLTLFPNPSTDYLYVQNRENYQGQIQLIDGLGRIIREYELLNSNKLDVLDLSSGLYHLNISIDDGKTQHFSFLKN